MLLAFDTATPLVTVALHDGEDVVAELRLGAADEARRAARAADRPGARARPGSSARTSPRSAVGVGPGPFTGLRVGLVTARTLGFVLEIPVYGVCTLDVLAVEAVDTGAVDATDFVVATDARRKEVYLATYDGDGARLDGPGGRPSRPTSPPSCRWWARAPCSTRRRSRTPVGPDAAERRLAGRAVIAEERAELHDPEPLYLRRPDAAAPGTPKPVS